MRASGYRAEPSKVGTSDFRSPGSEALWSHHVLIPLHNSFARTRARSMGSSWSLRVWESRTWQQGIWRNVKELKGFLVVPLTCTQLQSCCPVCPLLVGFEGSASPARPLRCQLRRTSNLELPQSTSTRATWNLALQNDWFPLSFQVDKADTRVKLSTELGATLTWAFLLRRVGPFSFGALQMKLAAFQFPCNIPRPKGSNVAGVPLGFSQSKRRSNLWGKAAQLPAP